MKGNPSQSELIYVNDLVDLLCERRTHPRRDLIGALQIPTLSILSAGGSDEESIKSHNGKDRASLHSASSRTGLSGGFRRERLMRSRNDANLLARRMVALDLDPYELTLSDPLVHHLQRQCTLCKSREGCLLDLAHECKGAAWRDRRKWREYCPNASALDILIVLQSRSKTAPRYSFPYLG